MTVRTPVITVMTACMRMIRSKPMTPPTMISAAMMIIDTAFTPSPPPQSETGKYGRGREHGDDREDGLPADAEQPRDERRQSIAPDTVGGATQHHRGGRPALAGGRDDAAQDETHDDADDRDDQTLPERDAEAQDVGAVTQSEDRDVGPEPGPEELAGLALALALGDDVDAVLFNAQRTGAAGAEYFGDFAHRTPFATPRVVADRLYSGTSRVRRPNDSTHLRRTIRDGRYGERMSASARLFCLDTVMIDIVVRIDQIPESGGDVLASEHQIATGGGYNAMSAAARQGVAAVYAGRLGRGPFSKIARTSFDHDDVDEPIEADESTMTPDSASR